jgi:ssDNA-binding Zn-finger/Zn-ribbon topoisomerase 1
MSLIKPKSMGECLYFTNRAIGEGNATAWAYRKACPKCTAGRLGKPIKTNGKVNKKSDYYECPKCKYQESNEAVEHDVRVEVLYKCPHCGSNGEATTEYSRKVFEGVPAYVFECSSCQKKIGITKKLKVIKKKK